MSRLIRVTRSAKARCNDLSMGRVALARLALAALVVLVLAWVVYFRLGWDRMDAHCNASPPGSETWDQVGSSWSWAPLGFTCTYYGGERDGDVETSLWF